MAVGPAAGEVRDSRSLYYVTMDEAKRAHRLWRHIVGSAEPDSLLLEEEDEMFDLSVARTRDDRWLLVTSGSMDSAEVRVVEAAGTSEDAAFLLAHEKGAETIVAVGSHGNLREFLDKGREGMSSTFLVRLRVGEILMDAKGVSRVYSSRIRTRDAVLLVAAAMVAIAAVVAVSPPLRLYVSQLFEQFRQWLFDLRELL